MTKRWRQWADEAWQRYVRRTMLAPGYERRYSTLSVEAAFKCGYDAGVSKAWREIQREETLGECRREEKS